MIKNSRSGFALGLILVVIVLMAAISTMMSATSMRFDIKPEISDIDIATFRDAAQVLGGSIARMANACDDADVSVCMSSVRDSLRSATPCENSAIPGILRNCPYAPPYGSATRRELKDTWFVGPIAATTKQWDIISNVSAKDSTAKNLIVLTMLNVTDEFCLSLEKKISTNRNATIQSGPMLNNSLPTNTLPIARREGCYNFSPSGPSPYSRANIYYLIVHTIGSN